MHAHTISCALTLEISRRRRVLVAERPKGAIVQGCVDLKNGIPRSRLNLLRLKRQGQIERGGLGVAAPLERHRKARGIRLVNYLAVRRLHGKLNDRKIGEEDDT